ncbi:MAG TPA: ABC transporter substrate-binding protein [Gaiellaceae bacterium]|nr:ABC transporter substrate-binding protein [Gaiellaceae bacterium]
MKGKGKALGALLACVAVAALGTSAASARQDSSSQQLQKLTLAYAPITDYAPIFVGLKRGFFKKEGIDLKTTNTNITPSSLVAASLSGQVDIATNSATATMTAISQGIPCKLLAAATTTPTKGNTEILVRRDSNIRRFRDLEGKVVGTVGLQGFFHLLTLNAVEKDGGDPSKVTAVPGAQQDSLNTLLAGRVDAVVLQDPFNTLAKLNNGVRSIGNPLGLFDPKTTAGVMIACGDIFQKKPDLLRRFLRAWQTSVDYSQKNPKFTKTIIPKYSGLTSQVTNLITIPTFTTALEPRVIGKFMKLMIKYGWVKGVAPSYSQLVWDRK